MSLRKRLNAVVGDVEIHVPPANPIDDVAQGLNTFGGQVTALYEERNHLKNLCEHLNRQCHILQSQLTTTAGDRDNWRRLAMRMQRIAGSLSSKLTTLQSIFHSAANEVLEVEHYGKQFPQPEPINGKDEEPVDLDAAFEQGAPEPTREEVDQLRSTLARLPQQ